MNKKNMAVLALAALVIVGTIIFVVRSVRKERSVPVPTFQKITNEQNNKVSPENNVPADNVTIDQMTEKQADFARDFHEKTKAK